MEKIASGKILTHMDRIHGSKRPITADIFLTNYCNNDCEYCTYKRHKLNKEPTDMPYEEFKRYIVRLKWLGVKGYILTGGGEPTLNPEFNQITGYLQRKKYKYGLNTNFNKLVKIRPEFLKVSLDGWDEDSYERIRGVRCYEQTVENIKEYASWKKRYAKNTLLGIQMVGTSLTDIKHFYEANRDLDVDYISIRPVESLRGKYYIRKEWEANEDPYMILTYLKQLADSDKRILINHKWNLIKHKETQCWGKWAQIAVDESGNVLFCCHKPFERVGQLMDRKILDIKRKARTDMRTCDIPCRMSASNYELIQYKQSQDPASFL